MHRAAQKLADACMARQGFSVGLPDLYEPPSDKELGNFLDRRYALVYDDKTARKYGLHVPRYVEHGTKLPPVDPAYTEQVMAALFGADGDRRSPEDVDVSRGRLTSGGCLGQAEAELATGSRYLVSIGRSYAQPVRALNLDQTSAEDPRVKAAQGAWSACMARAGYRQKTTLSDLGSIPGVDLNAPTPSVAEIQLALQEVKCQQQTRVVDIWFQVESEYQRAKIDEQAEVFAEIKKENQQLLQRAADLLGEAVPAGSGG